MEEVIIKAERRNVIGKQVKAYRRQGKIPAILYGRTTQPTPLWLDLHDASLVLGRLAPSALVALDVEGQKHLVLVREKQRDVIKGTLKHVDFQAVSMAEKLRVKVAVFITGEAPAVKDYNGVLVEGLDELEIESFPKDLPDRILVDISGLKQIGDAIHVRDVVLPKDVQVLDDPDEIVVVVTSQKAEVEAAVGEAGMAEPEVIEKGKKEEE